MAKLKFPYKNEGNQKYSQQLFLEKWRDMPLEKRIAEPPFTLNTPVEGYVCFRTEYVADADPSGYTTAMRIFKDYEYWKFLMKVSWFREAVDSWNDELDAKLYAEAMSRIRSISNDEDHKGSLQAAKFLATQGYKVDGSKAKRGRPSKEEVQGILKQTAEATRELEEDAQRIRMVHGG